ncbi:MAG: GlsB/YeaQ/YmgE family stress response membrane protein [Phycisphaerales bacterium]
MEFVWFLLIGLCAGWLAGQLFKGGGFGLVGNIIVGVIGAIGGGFTFGLLGLQANTLLGSLVTATVGAIVLLALLQIVARSQGRK